MTSKEFTDILNDMVVIVDTREQKNQHILDYLIANNVPYIRKKLDSGDYSFELPNYQHLNLDKTSVVERKNSIDEISQNFTKGRDRFIREFERIPKGVDVHLVIENFTWTKLLNGTYRSKVSPKSVYASLFTFSNRFGIKTWTPTKADSGMVIYNALYYDLYFSLKDLQKKC